MTTLATQLDTRSAQFAANRDAMLAKLAEIDAEHAKAIAGGGPIGGADVPASASRWPAPRPP